MTEEPWNRHTPGDPMPCKCGKSVVEVRFCEGGIDTEIANYWNWGEPKYGLDAAITAWRFVERKGEDIIHRCAECDCEGSAEFADSLAGAEGSKQ